MLYVIWREEPKGQADPGRFIWVTDSGEVMVELIKADPGLVWSAVKEGESK